MPEITVSVKQDETNPLVDSVTQLVNHYNVIVLVADMRTKNVELVATGETYEDPVCTRRSFYFRTEELSTEIAIRGDFQTQWRVFCEVSRYSAFMCLVKIVSSLGVNPTREVWRRDGKD